MPEWTIRGSALDNCVYGTLAAAGDESPNPIMAAPVSVDMRIDQSWLLQRVQDLKDLCRATTANGVGIPAVQNG
jgi:hypothetical protein